MNNFISFLRESYSEMVHKVSWPSYKDLQNSSVLVLVASLIFALVIWVVDAAFKYILTQVYESL